MNIIDNFKNIMEKAKGLTRKDLNTWRYTLIFLIIVSMIGIYYFLHAKKLGIALIVVFLIGLGFIMFLESRLPSEPKKVQNNAKKEVQKNMPEEEVAETEEVEESSDFGFDMGLPSSEEYNKRLDDAFTFKGL